MRQVVFTFEAVELHQTEHFFATRVARSELTSTGWTDLERRSMVSSRWWTAEELKRTADTYYPEDLLELLAKARLVLDRANSVNSDQGQPGSR